jgi:hypothetical protein
LCAQPKLSVSQPGDPYERQADTMAARITSGDPGAGVAAGPVGLAPLRLQRAPASAADVADLPAGLGEALRAPGPGSPIPAAVRAQIEPQLGVDLSGVQVHSGERAAEAAAQIGARAFTTGAHVYLGAGESADDLALMAHEATHVVQQAAAPVPASATAPPAGPPGDAPPVGTLLRAPEEGILPDFIMDAVKDLAKALPGYTMLTVVAGYDPIANKNVARTPENLVKGVIGLVPFGGLVADKLIELGVIQAAFKLVDDGLAAHNLTLARIQGDLDKVWNELSITKGVSGNVAVISGRVDKIYQDALAFAKGIVDSVVQVIRDAAVGLAEKYLVGTPSWDLAKKVLHHDPLRGTPVEATTVEILTDFLKLIGKQDALAQMQQRGTLQKTADWIDTQIARFLGLISELGNLFKAGWEAIQPANIASLPSNLQKLANDAIGLIGRVAAFATEVIGTVLKLIKDALLGWLSEHAHELKGFRLLTVILGQNPFTGQAVPRTAENLIGGFIALLPGGEATYAKLSEAGVIADAAAQIEGAMARLGISLEMITGTFKAIWNVLTLEDLLNPIGAFVKILDKFGEPLGRIVAFVGEVVKVVITLILKLMNFPSDLLASIITNAMQAIEDIKKDPVAFLLNMLQALKNGFLAFLDKVLSYLLSGLADWLFRGLGALGISKPPDLTLKSILTLVLQVLDLSVEKLWQKLGKHIGEETVGKIRKGLQLAGDAWDFIKDVEENGVAAIWKHVESQLGNLWDTLLNMAKDWIVEKIIQRVTAKLISMLDPTGIMAVVNSMIAFFNAVQSAIEYIREILTIVNDYVTTLAAVARGDVAVGAKKVEKGLGDAVPVAIGFLANQVGLGNVPEKVVEIIKGLRQLVDEALEWLFTQAVRLGKAALNAIGLGGDKKDDPAAADGASIVPTEKTGFAMHGASHTLWFKQVGGGKYQVFMATTPGWLKGRVDQALDDQNLPGQARPLLKPISESLGLLEFEVGEQEVAYRNAGTALNSTFFKGALLTKDQYRQKVTEKVTEYRAFLEGLGESLGITDLMNLGHRSIYVEGDSVASKYRGSVWRDTFYDGWDTTVYEKFKKTAFGEGLTYWRGLNPGATIPGEFDLYRCKECGDWFSSRGRVAAYPVKGWQLDHKEPVVGHFQNFGLHQTQDERNTWYNKETNLQGLCHTCNKESLRMDKWVVARRFRGKNDAPPDPADGPA